jgi:uncharacterized protein YjlB
MEQQVQHQPIRMVLNDDGIFPNSKFPALLYKGVLDIPFLFPATHVKKLFASHNWTNAWDSGVFEYHHYHSITHEVLGAYEGSTVLQLGGEDGPTIKFEKGDVLVIPAGVVHKNWGDEFDVQCVGAYPDGKDYDMNYGKLGERPKADENIENVPIPLTDPLYGENAGLTEIWC